jgi:hypothetical protein
VFVIRSQINYLIGILCLFGYRIRDNRGEGTLPLVIGGILLFTSYIMFPEMYHNFVHWAVKSIDSGVDDSFQGGYGNGGPKNAPGDKINLKGDGK